MDRRLKYSVEYFGLARVQKYSSISVFVFTVAVLLKLKSNVFKIKNNYIQNYITVFKSSRVQRRYSHSTARVHFQPH